MLLAVAIGSVVAFSPSSASLNVVTQPRRHSATAMQQHAGLGRRATLLGAGALAFSQQSAALAKAAPTVATRGDIAGDLIGKVRSTDPAFKVYVSALEQSEKLVFSDLGWGDAEIKVLSQELQYAKELKKLFLNGNRITDEGIAAIESALLLGAAPKLKILNLSQKPGLMSEKARQCLRASRPGLQISYANLKQPSDASTLLAADNGALQTARVIERAKGVNGALVDGSDATCAELKRIIDVDRVALKDLQEDDVKDAVVKQVERLVQLKSSKKCSA